MKKIFLSLVCVAFAFNAMAYDLATEGTEYWCSGTPWYKVVGLSDGTVAITLVGASESQASVTFPTEVWSSADPYPHFQVSQIGDGSSPVYMDFAGSDGHADVTTIVIPDGVNVAANALKSFTNLKWLTINGNTVVGEYAFYGDDALEGIWFNGTSIPACGEGAFQGSSSWDVIVTNCKVEVLTEEAKESFNHDPWDYWTAFYSNGKVGYASFDLWDNAAFDSQDKSWYNEHYVNVTMKNRSFTAGEWHTFRAPFAMTAWNIENTFGTGAEVVYLSEASKISDEAITLSFTSTDWTVAGHNYLVKPTIDVTDPVFNGVYYYEDRTEAEHTEVVGDAFKVTTHGLYEPKTLASNEYFLGHDNTLYHPNNDGEITTNAYRIYFTFSESLPNFVRPRIVMNGQQTTGLEDVQSDNVQSIKVVENGQLFILRAGHKYTVDGRIVK